jgi:hypothetical protein
VPLPARTGLGPVEVIAVDATAVTMVIPLTGPKFDSDGGCSPFITGPAAGSSGFVTLSCAAGDRGVLNKVTLEVPEIADGSAVLRARGSNPAANSSQEAYGRGIRWRCPDVGRRDTGRSSARPPETYPAHRP